ncbi:MAG: sugar ABC transporter substrate-binding protein [Desulfitobacteriaceae bacterium]|nr:sugar ABC transporter substrate-binding protein [Desulfitobacteriaceae bacterium]
MIVKRCVIRSPLIIAILCATMLLLSGCHRGKDRVIIHWLWWPVTPEWDKALADLIEEFERTHPGVVIKPDKVGWQGYQSKVLTLGAAGMCPDIIMSCVEAGFYSLYLERGLIMDLTPFIGSDPDYNLSDFFPCGLDAFRENGKLYGIPVDMNPCIMYYNKKIFDEAGEPYPDGTWDTTKLLQVARKLTKDTNGDGRIDQCGFAYDSYLYWLLRAGIDLTDANHTRVTFNTPKAADVLQFLVDLRLKYGVTPSLSFQQMGNSYELFSTGRIAMFEGIPAYCSHLLRNKRLDWDIAPVVQLGKKPVVNLPITGYSISSQTKHPREAWQFVRFITSPAAYRYMRIKTGNIPPRRSVCEDPKVFGPPPGNIKLIVDILKYAQSTPHFTRLPELMDVANRGFDKMTLGQQSVRRGLAIIEKEGNEILSRPSRMEAPRG